MQKLYFWRRFTDRLKADADGTPQDEYLIEDLPKILRERVKKITGLPDWKTSPERSMKTLGDELDAHEARTDNPHSVTAAQAGAVPTTQRGTANGVATLDATTKIPISQIPDTVVGGMDYQGTWNASTNVPAITTISKSKGDYWKVATAGATNLSGTTDWKIGDWAVWNGSSFDKIDNTDQVTSVEGRQGAVTLSDLYPRGTVGTPQDGQVWTYDTASGGWIPKTPAAGGGGISQPGYISGANLEWVSPSSVRLSPGSAMVDGTLRTWTSALTLSGISGTANTIRYIYLGVSGSTPVLTQTTTAPTYDETLDYWRGSTAASRCVGFVQLSDTGAVNQFTCISLGRVREWHYVPQANISGATLLASIQVTSGATNTTAWSQRSLSSFVPIHATHYFLAAKLGYTGAGQDAAVGVSPLDMGANNPASYGMYTVRDSNGLSGGKTFFGRSWMPIVEPQTTYTRMQVFASGSPNYEIESHGARFMV